MWTDARGQGKRWRRQHSQYRNSYLRWNTPLEPKVPEYRTFSLNIPPHISRTLAVYHYLNVKKWGVNHISNPDSDLETCREIFPRYFRSYPLG